MARSGGPQTAGLLATFLCAWCALVTAQTCPPGYGTPSCTICFPGTASDGLNPCSNCLEGFFAANAAAPQCALCPAGQRSTASSGSTSCSDCEPGTFSNSARLCTTCPIGTVSSQPAAVACTACSPGTVANSQRTNCTTCPAGTYSPAGVACLTCGANSIPMPFGPGATQCTNCAAGSSALSGNTNCTLCPAGSANPTAGASCNLCTANTFAANPGTVTCTLCPAGSSSPSNSASCTLCPAGSAGSTAGAGCTVCPANQFANALEGATACLPCPAGQFSSSSSTACTPCPSGQYGPAPGAGCAICSPNAVPNALSAATACLACQAATSASPGDTTCAPCVAGSAGNVTGGGCSVCGANRYANALLGATACLLCDARFWSNVGSTGCSLCEPGTAGNVAGNGCAPCPANWNATGPGAPLCEPCPPATFSPTRSPTCSRCQPGSAGNTAGMGCPPCPNGFIAPGLGNTQCTPCGPGEGSLPVGTGGVECYDCYVGYANPSSGQPCLACPRNTFTNTTRSVTCTDCRPREQTLSSASSGCTLCSPGTANPLPRSSCTPCTPGYFTEFSGQLQCEACSAGFQSSPPFTTCERCVPGTFNPRRGSLCVDCQFGDRSCPFFEMTACSFPYTGSRCERCVEDFYLKTAFQECRPCPPRIQSAVIMIGALAIFLGILYSVTGRRTFEGHAIAILTLTLECFQQIYVLIQRLTIPWPEQVKRWYESIFLLTNGSADIFVPQCIFPIEDGPQYALQFVMPILLAAMLFVVLAIRNRFASDTMLGAEMKEKERPKFRAVWFACFLIYFRMFYGSYIGVLVKPFLDYEADDRWSHGDGSVMTSDQLFSLAIFSIIIAFLLHLAMTFLLNYVPGLPSNKAMKEEWFFVRVMFSEHDYFYKHGIEWNQHPNFESTNVLKHWCISAALCWCSGGFGVFYFLYTHRDYMFKMRGWNWSRSWIPMMMHIRFTIQMLPILANIYGFLRLPIFATIISLILFTIPIIKFFVLNAKRNGLKMPFCAPYGDRERFERLLKDAKTAYPDMDLDAVVVEKMDNINGLKSMKVYCHDPIDEKHRSWRTFMDERVCNALQLFALIVPILVGIYGLVLLVNPQASETTMALVFGSFGLVIGAFALLIFLYAVVDSTLVDLFAKVWHKCVRLAAKCCACCSDSARVTRSNEKLKEIEQRACQRLLAATFGPAAFDGVYLLESSKGRRSSPYNYEEEIDKYYAAAAAYTESHWSPNAAHTFGVGGWKMPQFFSQPVATQPMGSQYSLQPLITMAMPGAGAGIHQPYSPQPMTSLSVTPSNASLPNGAYYYGHSQSGLVGMPAQMQYMVYDQYGQLVPSNAMMPGYMPSSAMSPMSPGYTHNQYEMYSYPQ